MTHFLPTHIQFANVKPSASDFNICKELISQISDLAPSDASVSAIIRRLADGTYHTKIPVRASDASFVNGDFYSEGKTRSLLTSLKQAQIEMIKKLKEWKENRY